MKQKERKERKGKTANGQRKEGTNEREKVKEAGEKQERNGERGIESREVQKGKVGLCHNQFFLN